MRRVAVTAVGGVRLVSHLDRPAGNIHTTEVDSGTRAQKFVLKSR